MNMNISQISWGYIWPLASNILNSIVYPIWEGDAIGIFINRGEKPQVPIYYISSGAIGLQQNRFTLNSFRGGLATLQRELVLAAA